MKEWVISQEWQPVDSVPELLSNEIALWRIDPLDLSSFAEACVRLLSAEETRRLQRFVNAQSRREFLLCRGILRILLAHLTGQAPKAMALGEGSQGKPQIVDDENQHSISFNVSHTENLCLIACSRDCEVGVDVEKVHAIKDLFRMAQTYLSPEEFAAWRELDGRESTGIFIEYWCAKEAILKATGAGLSIHPSQVNTFEALTGHGVRGVQENGGFFDFPGCRLQKLPLSDDHRGWLAFFGNPNTIHFYEINQRLLSEEFALEGRKDEK